MPAKKSTRTKTPAPAAKAGAKAAPKPVVAATPVKKAVAAKTAPVAAKKSAVAVVKAAVKKVPKAPVKTPAKTVAKTVAKSPAKLPGSGVFVRFERYSPKSSRVDLVGSFNGWDLGKYPLVRDENGVWSIQIRLAPGTYEYKYVYDGHFYEPDPEQEQVANAFGSANNLLIVT
jgi:hypothetical protein